MSTVPGTHCIVSRHETLDGATVLPGFSVKVADIFDALNLGPDKD